MSLLKSLHGCLWLWNTRVDNFLFLFFFFNDCTPLNTRIYHFFSDRPTWSVGRHVRWRLGFSYHTHWDGWVPRRCGKFGVVNHLPGSEHLQGIFILLNYSAHSSRFPAVTFLCGRFHSRFVLLQSLFQCFLWGFWNGDRWVRRGNFPLVILTRSGRALSDGRVLRSVGLLRGWLGLSCHLHDRC